jgi:hypothetical protein
VKNPSCGEVEVEKWTDYKLENYKDVPFFKYKIIIPKTRQQIIDEDFAGGLNMGQILPKQETLEEAAENNYCFERDVEMVNFISEMASTGKIPNRWSAFVAKINELYLFKQEQDKKLYSEEDFLKFSEWVSHNDWVYLPSKAYWVNEEQEEFEQKFTTKELFKQFKNK